MTQRALTDAMPPADPALVPPESLWGIAEVARYLNISRRGG